MAQVALRGVSNYDVRDRAAVAGIELGVVDGERFVLKEKRGNRARKGCMCMIVDKSELVAFVATTQPEKARAFYCDVLGLGLEEDSPFALVLRGANAMVRVQKVQSFTPLPFTALGWKVEDVRAVAKRLLEKGVACERFEGMSQDDLGIWASPSGSKVCWFKDPDGNILSLTQ